MYTIVIDTLLNGSQKKFLLGLGFQRKSDGRYEYQTESAEECHTVMLQVREKMPAALERAQRKRRKKDKQSDSSATTDSASHSADTGAAAMKDITDNTASGTINSVDTTNTSSMKDVDDEDEHADVEDNEDEHRVKPKPDSYIVVDNTGKETFLEDFVKRSPTQMSASIYHSIYDKSVNADKVYYIRNQSLHPISNTKNTEDGDPLSDRLQASRDPLFTKATKDYTVGLNPAFGHEINHKEYDPSKTKKPHVDSAATQRLNNLVDTILDQKNAGVEYVVKTLQSSPDKLNTVIVDPNQLSARYPCLIVRLNDLYRPHQIMKAKGTLNEYDAAYTNFLTHLLIACINKELLEKGVGHFIDKRQSFAFMSPTGSDVSEAIRLSFGLIPNKQWLDCVATGIQNFDKTLQHLWDKKAIQNVKDGMGTPHAKFRAGNIDTYGHKLFLAELLKKDPLDSLTAFISKLDSNYDTIKKQAEKADYFEGLVDQLLKKDKVPVDDSYHFIQIYKQIYSLFSALNESPSDTIDFDEGVSELMREYNDLLYQYKLKSVGEVAKLDAIEITSESSDDEANTEILNRGNKQLAPVGMSALSYPMIVFDKVLPNKLYYKVEPYGYFELHSIHASKKRAEKIDSYKDATIVYTDNNPCVNRADRPIPVAETIDNFSKAIVLSENPQMLVVDITSSTQAEIKAIEEKWLASNIPLIYFAKSGIKNMQFGLDMAQYGEGRLLINNRLLKSIPDTSPIKAKLVENCKAVAEELDRTTKATSSVYATHVRRQIRSTLQSLELPSDVQVDDSTLSEAEKALIKFIQTKQIPFQLTTGNIIIDPRKLQDGDLKIFTENVLDKHGIKFEDDTNNKRLVILLTNFSTNFAEKLKLLGKPSASSDTPSSTQKPKTVDRSAQLIDVSAAGDDRNLHTHGSNPRYWYSIADGLRLLESIRHNKLTYRTTSNIDYRIKAPGEEYSFNRQNRQGILLADPYYIDRSPAAIRDFQAALLSNIKTITGGHTGTDDNRNHAWDRMPQMLIIPLLTGAHWSCIRVQIDYTNNRADILWDDPYGNFAEGTRANLLPALKIGIQTLIRKHCEQQARHMEKTPYMGGSVELHEKLRKDYAQYRTNAATFVLTDAQVTNRVKMLDQQGHGENGFDCGPINFSNIENYTDPTISNEAFANSTAAANRYLISPASAADHETQMNEIRARDIGRYETITGETGPLDATRQERVNAIKKSLAQERERLQQQAEKSESSNIPQQIQRLTDSDFAIVLAILDNNRIADKSIKASQEYTSVEWDNAYKAFQAQKAISVSTDKSKQDLPQPAQTFVSTDKSKQDPSQPVQILEKNVVAQQYIQMSRELQKRGSLALADAWASNNELINFLNAKTADRKDILVSRIWATDDGASAAVMFEGTTFPLKQFIENFCCDATKKKFIVPIQIDKAHYCGLIIEKTDTGQFNFIYFNPTEEKNTPSGENKKLESALSTVPRQYSRESSENTWF